MGSTRIMLETMAMYDVPVRLKESSKFAMPFLRWDHAPLQWPGVNTLAGVFLEACFPELSSRWLHVQISSPNEFVLQKVRAMSGRRLNLMGRVASPVLGRLMIAYGGLHSDHSHEIELRLLRRAGASSLSASRIDAHDTDRLIDGFARRLASCGGSFRTRFVLGMLRRQPAGLTAHYGGSFPMSSAPGSPLSTDTLGRPVRHRRVHLVDGSIFPSVPGTTVALLIMANAHRIASDAPMD